MLLESIIQTLIDLAKERMSSATKPKAKAARAFVQLYSALVDCHEAYLVWKMKARKKRSSEYADWIKSIDELSRAVSSVKTQLNIFAPNLQKTLVKYVCGEMAHAPYNEKELQNIKDLLLIDSGDIKSVQVVVGPMLKNMHSNSENSHDNEADKPPSELKSGAIAKNMKNDLSYERSEELLRNFIRQEFKLEDLF